jgi:subtilisin family serine protease
MKYPFAKIVPLGLILAGSLVACPPPPSLPKVNVAVVTPQATLLQVAVNSSITFKATNENNVPVGVIWSNTGAGSIDLSGIYLSPNTLPSDPKVVIKATSKTNPSDFGTLEITIVGQGTVGMSGTITVPTALLPNSSEVLPTSTSSTPRASQQVVTDWNAPHLKGQVLILGDNTRLRSARSLQGLKVRNVMTGVSSVSVPGGENEKVFAERVALETGLSVQPEYIYRTMGEIPTPNDTNFEKQGYFKQIDASGAWSVKRDVPDGLIAIIDSGVKTNHPDLKDRFILGKDFCVTLIDTGCSGEDNDPEDVPATVIGGGHGTGVMGIIASATNNTNGVAGITWGGKVLVIKVFAADGGNYAGTTTSAVAKALKYAADQGAKVVNMSLGIPFTKGATDVTLDEAIDYAATKGVLMVAAAGNTNEQGLPGKTPKPGEAQKFDRNIGVYYPARNDKVIAVGSVSGNNTISDFCNPKNPDPTAPETINCFASAQGPEVDIVAPGEKILSTNVLGDYQENTGTSEAAPQVAAVAGLIRAANSGLSVTQVKNVLTSTAVNLGAANTFGAGLLQAGAALGKAGVTVYIYADPCLEGSGATCTKYADGSPNLSDITGRVIVQIDRLTGTGAYTLTLTKNGMSAIPAGTYRIVACVNKNNDKKACNPAGPDLPDHPEINIPVGDLGGSQSGVVYDGTKPVTGINITLRQL